MSRDGSFVSDSASHKLVFGAVRAAGLEYGSHSAEHLDIGEMQTERLASRQMRKTRRCFQDARKPFVIFSSGEVGNEWMTWSFVIGREEAGTAGSVLFLCTVLEVQEEAFPLSSHRWRPTDMMFVERTATLSPDASKTSQKKHGAVCLCPAFFIDDMKNYVKNSYRDTCIRNQFKR